MKGNKLMEKMMKAGSIKHSSILSESTFFNKREPIKTRSPSLNIAFTGDLDGGLLPGVTVVAGPSRHYKSNLGLVGVRAFLEKFEDGVCLFYDSEYGITPSYVDAQGVDASRLLHIPIQDIEELKFDIVQRLKEIERGDKVMFFIDSIGNLASNKEVQDALDGKSVADMTRAKQIKSLFRIITPQITAKELYCLVINHTYQTQEMYSKAVVSGGTGIMYSANTVFILGRAQEKDGQDLVGYNFTINIEKSRFVKEKSKIPFVVTYDGGIDPYSGILELALESGDIIKPKVGWYAVVDPETGEVSEKNFRAKDFASDDIGGMIMKRESFKEFIRNKYRLGEKQIKDAIESEKEIDEEIDEYMNDSIED